MCEEVGNGNGSFADADKPQVREFSEALLKLAEYAPEDILESDVIREPQTFVTAYIRCISVEPSIWQISWQEIRI